MIKPDKGNSLLLPEKQKDKPSVLPININGVINRVAYLLQQNAEFLGIPCEVTEENVREQCKQMGLFDIHLFYDGRLSGHFTNSKTLDKKLLFHATIIAKSAIINFYQTLDLCDAMNNKINMKITPGDLKKTVKHHLSRVCNNAKAIESAIKEMKIGEVDILGYKKFYKDWSWVFKKFGNNPTESDGKSIRISVYGAGNRETSYDSILTYDNTHFLYLPQEMKSQLRKYYVEKGKECKKYLKDSLIPYFPAESLEKLFTQLRKYKCLHKEEFAQDCVYDIDFIKSQMQKVLDLYPDQSVFKKSYDKKQEVVKIEKTKEDVSDFDSLLSQMCGDEEETKTESNVIDYARLDFERQMEGFDFEAMKRSELMRAI